MVGPMEICLTLLIRMTWELIMRLLLWAKSTCMICILILRIPSQRLHSSFKLQLSWVLFYSRWQKKILLFTIGHQLIIIRTQFFKVSLGLNPRIFVYEDHLWSIKGHYSAAINDEEPIAWDFVNREYILPISVVHFYLYLIFGEKSLTFVKRNMISLPSPLLLQDLYHLCLRILTPASTSEGLTSVLADMSLNLFKKDLMTHFDIPFNLADHKDSSLYFAYQKYKTFLQANQTLAELCSSEEWAGKKPSVTDLIEIFQSKSMWHSHHSKAFSRVSDYPEMVSWLEKKKDVASNIEVWGYEKALYNFKDLFAYLDGKLKEEDRSKFKGKAKAKNESKSGSRLKKEEDKKKKASK
jgi:hypothetical protein